MIEINGIYKNFGAKQALRDVSFNVAEGEIMGFLGPNGAGKTTTMNILTGYLSATAGTARIDGVDVLEKPLVAKSKIGFLPEQPPLYMDMTVKEYLNFVYGLKNCRLPRAQHIKEICEVVRIGDVYGRIIKNLSKGYRQRVGIAQALLGNPKVIILDEPTVGLDPKQIVEIRELIKSLGREHTVVLSSHILSEVQAVCDTVLIISKGCLVACDTPENLEKLFAGKARIELDTDADKAKALELAGTLPGVTKIDAQPHDNGCRLTIELSGDDTGSVCRELSLRFAGAGHAILQMTTAKASLEDIFIELTDGEKEAGKA